MIHYYLHLVTFYLDRSYAFVYCFLYLVNVFIYVTDYDGKNEISFSQFEIFYIFNIFLAKF